MQKSQEQQLQELLNKLEKLSVQQQNLAADISSLRKEIEKLHPALHASRSSVVVEPSGTDKARVAVTPPVPTMAFDKDRFGSLKKKNRIEEFIGTNLLNKIGIAILVIGLSIGVKYAIDNELISPLARIILGYTAGALLLGFALRLKNKYLNFSAVLLSGAMSVLYFMTFSAYEFYGLVSQIPAFIIMVILTVSTVFAALRYNLQAIAIIGLAGAYAVPFLLSDGSGRIVVLFTYIIIINAGILFLGFRKAWKALYYIAFTLTWLIFYVWFISRFEAEKDLTVSLLFSTLFFVLFYIIILSYKTLQKEGLSRSDIVVLLLNSFLYYSFGYFAIEVYPEGRKFLGLFTLSNAVLQTAACLFLYRKREISRDTFYFTAGMVMVFITLAVPVQFSAHWVTLIWVFESALLFWIGRTKSAPAYERISYALAVLGSISLLHDWSIFYQLSLDESGAYAKPSPVNIQLVSSLVICSVWGCMVYIGHKYTSAIPSSSRLPAIFRWTMSCIFIFALYMTFFNEINFYWKFRYAVSPASLQGQEHEKLYNTDLLHFRKLWLLIYSSFFLILLWYINKKRINSTILNYIISGCASLTLIILITGGLYSLQELRKSYLAPDPGQYRITDHWHIIIRYLGLAFLLPLLRIINLEAAKTRRTVRKTEHIFTNIVILTLSSSELINVLELTGVQNSDRLALSVLWGGYAFGLIIYGLKKQEKITRIAAITLFAITLIKLFFYDLAAMSTISKTIVMVILGVLLLTASFLYNKLKATEPED